MWPVRKLPQKPVVDIRMMESSEWMTLAWQRPEITVGEGRLFEQTTAPQIYIFARIEAFRSCLRCPAPININYGCGANA